MKALPGGGGQVSGFVCGSLRRLGGPRASEEGAEADRRENYLTLQRECVFTTSY